MDPELSEADMEAINKLIDEVEKSNKQWKMMEESRRIAAANKATSMDEKFDRIMALLEKMMPTPTSEAAPELCVPVETDMVSKGTVNAVKVDEDSSEPELDSKAAEFYFGAVKVDGMVESVESASAEIDLASIDVTDKSDSAIATGVFENGDLDVSTQTEAYLSPVNVDRSNNDDQVSLDLVLLSDSALVEIMPKSKQTLMSAKTDMESFVAVFDYKTKLMTVNESEESLLALINSENLCVKHVRQNASEYILPVELESSLPFWLQLWKGINGVQRCLYVKLVDGNFVYDKGKSHMYANEWQEAGVEMKMKVSMDAVTYNSVLAALNKYEMLSYSLPNRKPPRLPPANDLKIGVLDAGVAELENGVDSLFESSARFHSQMLSVGQIAGKIGDHACLNIFQREAMKDARRIAGLEVIRSINEHTVIFMEYEFEKKNSGQILVFDPGGGTFNVSVHKEFANLYVVEGTSLMNPAITVLLVNLIAVAVAVGVSKTIYNVLLQWSKLNVRVFFSFWVLTKFMVYDYMYLGSSPMLVHGNIGANRTLVSWEMRFGIILGVASGIAYPHMQGSGVYHGHTRICFVNEIDHHGAVFFRTRDMTVTNLGDKPMAELQRLSGSKDIFRGSVDLVKMKTIVWSVAEFSYQDIYIGLEESVKECISFIIETMVQLGDLMMDCLEGGELEDE